MIEIDKTFLLAGNKFMPEIHLRQLGFTYSACGPLTKNKEKIEKCKGKADSRYFIKTNWIKLVLNMSWLMEILKI